MLFFLLDITPRFISEPSSTVQKSGEPVQLRCSAEPSTAHISWLFNGEPLRSRVGEVEMQAGSLTIVSLSAAACGRYQCVASSGVGAVLSRPATVSMGSKFICIPVLCSFPILSWLVWLVLWLVENAQIKMLWDNMMDCMFLAFFFNYIIWDLSGDAALEQIPQKACGSPSLEAFKASATPNHTWWI